MLKAPPSGPDGDGGDRAGAVAALPAPARWDGRDGATVHVIVTVDAVAGPPEAGGGSGIAVTVRVHAAGLGGAAEPR